MKKETTKASVAKSEDKKSLSFLVECIFEFTTLLKMSEFLRFVKASSISNLVKSAEFSELDSVHSCVKLWPAPNNQNTNK